MDGLKNQISEASGEMLDARVTSKPIEERLDAVSMSQVHSFWREMQDLLQEAAAEIRRLKENQK